MCPVRSMVGYSDATLGSAKMALAEQLEVDPSDLDAVLADRFALQLCTSCGHWFHARDCSHDDGQGGFTCRPCADIDRV